ncbi:MAG: NAD-dependent epimerase/dehydratase family protein [Acidobacteria bacterium]|nr:NAD-dependent epimerase/dehydratase family protein [Acidobacteriota bacterium]
MSVLVTGGAGFLGSHVAGVLAASGLETAVVDDLSTGSRDRIPAGVPLIEADVRDARAISEAIGLVRPRAVVHLAARRFPPGEVPASAAVDVNIAGALVVARAAFEAGVGHFVFASSAAVYGELTAKAATEDFDTDPRTANGVSKLAVEGFLRIARDEQNVAVSILRFANLYGPGSSSAGGSAVHEFVERSALGEPHRIDGGGGQTRDFVFVADAARAVAAVLDARADGVFNVGTGDETSIDSLSRMVWEAAGGAPQPPVHRAGRAGDLRRSCLDGARLHAATGFRPSTALAGGLAVTFESRREITFQA